MVGHPTSCWLGERKQLLVLNKADLLTERPGKRFAPAAATAENGSGSGEWPPQALLVSAAEGWGLEELLLGIEGALAAGGTEAAYSQAYQVTGR
ncbi:MAG: hypothetical protein V3S00_01190 [Dehalococcoidia bacterium]